jgi:ATP-grasp domain
MPSCEPCGSKRAAGGTRSVRKTYVILNPHDDYSAHLIDLVFHKYGLRPICLYTDRKLAFYRRSRYPILQSGLVEAEYHVDMPSLPGFAAEVRRRYRVLGVVPAIEQWVELAARLSDLLGLDWMSGEILARFRDKNGMKAYLRQHAPHLRVPQTTPIRAVEEVFANGGPASSIRGAGDRFVLKPNDGTGGVNVAIFPEAVSRETVAAHMARSPGQRWAMEEFIGGRELAVNGQVGPDGRGLVLVITEYKRVQVNGRDNISDTDFKVDQTDPVFAPIEQYALEVVSALGLRRSPFHMEVKLDARGPCLIDLGARLIGNGGAFMCGMLHPGRPDLFDLAAHGYLFGDRYGLDRPIDWSWYNGHSYAAVDGIAERDELITTLDGVEEVEALPEFVRWEYRPQVGQQVRRTLDLFTIPYAIDLLGEGSMADMLAVCRKVRETVRWNRRRASPRALIAARSRHFADRAGPKLRWLAHRYLMGDSG